VNFSGKSVLDNQTSILCIDRPHSVRHCHGSFIDKQVAMRYSAWNVFKQGLTGHKHWPSAFRDPDPKREYDVIIVGGGGHGLATAWYLASRHGTMQVSGAFVRF